MLYEILLVGALIAIVSMLFTFAKNWLDARERARGERVRLLEEALKNPNVDRGTVEALAYQLTGARRPRGGPGRFLALVLALGWITLFAGIGVSVLGEVTHDKEALAGGIVTAIVGFGLVTYPFALRELEARRAQS